MNQYPYVRDLSYCPHCKEPKDKGLILCWPCHHTQKDRHDGGYGPKLSYKLAVIESALAREWDGK